MYTKTQLIALDAIVRLSRGDPREVEIMLATHVEKLGDLALIDCKGRLVKSDSVFELRDVVMAQKDAHIIALDLYDVEAMGGGGLGMLAFLQQWATEHDIQLKLFTPSQPVMEELQRTRETLGLEIANLNEMMSILSRSRRASAPQNRRSYVI